MYIVQLSFGELRLAKHTHPLARPLFVMVLDGKPPCHKKSHNWLIPEEF